MRKVRKPQTMRGVRNRFRNIFKPEIRYSTKIYENGKYDKKTYVIMLRVQREKLEEMKAKVIEQFGDPPYWGSYKLRITKKRER